MRANLRWKLIQSAIGTSLLWAGHCNANSNDYHFETVYQTRWSAGIDPTLVIQAPANAISVVQNDAFGGAALKVVVHRQDDFKRVANGTPRAEVAFARLFHFIPGFVYEIRWSTMIPSEYEFDSAQPELFSQILQGPKGGLGSPPFSIRFVNQRYQVEVRNAADSPAHIFVFGDPEGDRGKVVKWMLRYAPSHDGRQAVTDLYMDGTQVVSCDRCGNAYANDVDAYLKLGLYKWWWQSRPSDVQTRVIYFGGVDVIRRRSQ